MKLTISSKYVINIFGLQIPPCQGCICRLYPQCSGHGVSHQEININVLHKACKSL